MIGVVQVAMAPSRELVALLEEGGGGGDLFHTDLSTIGNS
jgi:hypothetical protein